MRKKVDWRLRYTSLVSSALAEHGIRSAAAGSNSRLQAGAYYSPPTDSPVWKLKFPSGQPCHQVYEHESHNLNYRTLGVAKNCCMNRNKQYEQ